MPPDERDAEDRAPALPDSLVLHLLEVLDAPAGDQERRLEELCGRHPEVAGEIRRSFESYRDAERHIADDRARGCAPTEEPPHGALPGKLPEAIGPYRVLALLGEGGMGNVYLAEQKAPVRRRVAVKLIKLGMDTEDYLARFETERQALALMDHPNIAHVLDAGSTADGRPYYAMEHVPGVPITRYCDTHRLGTRERLGLFLEVCQGVQHAHQKGIIHRDLKPSNILVQMHDGRPLPKIIDFGVAKAIDHRLTERTLYTQEGRIIGTPAYMSPEQAEMSGLDVDTRSDVYSLGILLYELITGRLPFDPEELARGSYFDIQRRIREEEPPKPSAKVATADDVGRRVAALRGTDPHGLARRLRGDLDWITMRAIEKDPVRRYQTAFELSADIRRHLDNEPVLASPPSAVYRLRKFVRRYRVQVAAGAAVAAGLLVGVIGMGTGYYKASETLANFNRLAILVKLRQAQELEKDLYPAWPDREDDMRSWLEEWAEPLVRELPDLRRTLEALETRVPASRSEHPPGRSPSQPDVERFLRDTLAALIEELEDFREHELRSVRRRLAWAGSVAERSIGAHRERWRRAIAAIRSSDGERSGHGYGGLEITPQLGLVPVGADPRSGLWEFAHLRSGAEGRAVPERDPDTGELELTADSGIVFVLLPPGTFPMGASRDPSSPCHDPEAQPDEAPVRPVKLSAFFLSKYEMTQAQWMRLSGGENPSEHRPGTRYRGQGVITALNPVERVSFTMCRDLLRRHGLELPTEAQWEFACRAGARTSWCTGRERETLVGLVNIADRTAGTFETWASIAKWPEFDDGYYVHAPVDALAPNGFGLHHVHGNVWEWCRDWYGSYHHDVEPRDGLRRVPDSGYRVVRGGSFRNEAKLARCASRRKVPAGVAVDYLGVRPARRLLAAR